MAPRQSTADKKAAAMAALAALMAEEGQEISDEQQEEWLTVTTRREKEIDTRRMEMEGVLRQVHHKHMLMLKVCEFCKRPFETNLCWTAYCSDSCRNDAFQAQYGISWSRLKVKPTQGFWEYEPTLIISPDTVDQMYEYSKWYVEHYEEIKQRSAEIPPTHRKTNYPADVSRRPSIAERADNSPTTLDSNEPAETLVRDDPSQSDYQKEESHPFEWSFDESSFAPWESY